MAERLEHVGGGMRWKLLFLLFVLSAVTYLDRVNLSIVGTSLMRWYGLTDLELGWMFSAFLLAYGLFQTPAGWFADRVGPRRALAWASVWWGLFTVLTTVVPAGRYAIVVLIGVRFLLGCGEAVLYPAASLLTENWVPSHEKGKVNGLIFAGVGAGAGISPPLISFVMSRAGWRASFWLSAGIGLCVGLVWYLVARDRPEEHPKASVEERAYRAGARVASSGSAWAVIRSWNLLAITAAYFTFGYVAWLFFSWFYIYLARERHLDLKQSAIYGMLPFLAMGVGSFAGGALSDWLTRRRGVRVGRCVVAAVALSVAAIVLVMGIRVESAGPAAVILSLGAGILYVAQSAFWAVTTDLAGEASGTVSGFMNMGAQAGGAATASLTPWIARQWGWDASFIVAAAFAVVGAGLWLTVNPRRRDGRVG